MVLFFISIQQFHSQEDGVVALSLPVRNSLKFNKYAINPTFSFVREQNKYISFSNKREWVQFDDAPQTYLFSYSGRFKENIGVGIGLFQQNYGVLTTFGGLLNFAYNAVLNRDQNLTFGLNLGAYNSGLNEGRVVINTPDSSLENIPSNTLITINPGINFGTEFFDFGLSINNIVAYNLTSSKMIEENPEQSIQGHIMYTGYVDSRGFFDESKFSGLVRSEFKKDKTVVSGIMMLTVPKGIWAQAGYSSLYGVSGGVGLNITSQIALEYNYEKAIGDLLNFGNSHEITLAYKFKNKYRYNYSGDDDEQALLISNKKPKRAVASRKPVNKKTTNTPKENIQETKVEVEEENRLAQETRAKEEAEAKIIEAEQAAKVEEQKRLKEIQAQEQVEAKRLAQEAQDRSRIEAENKAKEQAILEAENRIKAQEEAKRIAQEVEERTRIEEEKARIKAEEQDRIKQAEEQVRLEAENKAKEDALAQADAIKKEKLEAQQKIDTVKLDGVLVPVASDREALAMESLTKLTDNSKIEQQDLLKRLGEAVAIKQKDLDDLKEENDLREQGIVSGPKPFKSVSAENAMLESLKLDINNIIESQNIKISELENLYKERLKNIPDKNDEVNAYYLKAIESLKSEQIKVLESKENLISTLGNIKVATEFERKRRIKRAAYDNEEQRYTKDRAALNAIKQNTSLSSVPLEVNDLDFGEERSANIQIVKDVKNVENGYYLVLAIHSEVEKRDDFLTKVIASGKSDIDFFFDVNTSKYYIYSEKFDSVENARKAVQSIGNEPFNSEISMVKIEN